MLQQDKPEDFVIATGELNSLEDFVDTVFSELGLNWKDHVMQNEAFMRPTELLISFGNPEKAKKVLNCSNSKYASETHYYFLIGCTIKKNTGETPHEHSL